jgi:tRNA (guanine-N7-)-methyltransferase
MSLSLSRGKQLDVGHHGIAQDDLPPMEEGTLDPRAWYVESGESAAADAPSTPMRPIELEIGSGKGTFLVQHAELYPEVDFLGIEWATAFWRYAADRARRRRFNNVRVLRCDAGMFVQHYIPDNVFRQVHIYFPDPWPKKRHHKRRLFQADFLRELHRILIPAEPGKDDTAQVRIATDHVEYFEWMQEHAAKVTDIFERMPFESPKSAGEGELVGTNFERKYRLEGRTFQGMILRKRS